MKYRQKAGINTDLIINGDVEVVKIGLNCNKELINFLREGEYIDTEYGDDKHYWVSISICNNGCKESRPDSLHKKILKIQLPIIMEECSYLIRTSKNHLFTFSEEKFKEEFVEVEEVVNKDTENAVDGVYDVKFGTVEAMQFVGIMDADELTKIKTFLGDAFISISNTEILTNASAKEMLKYHSRLPENGEVVTMVAHTGDVILKFHDGYFCSISRVILDRLFSKRANLKMIPPLDIKRCELKDTAGDTIKVTKDNIDNIVHYIGKDKVEVSVDENKKPDGVYIIETGDIAFAGDYIIISDAGKITSWNAEAFAQRFEIKEE